jgi:multidrug efflux pump subunit AcrA (membrane-fusion protein)
MVSEKPSLDDLRIDRSDAEVGTGRGRLWAILAVIALLGLAGWWWLARPRPVEVRTAAAQVREGGSAAAAGAVLNASGYVTARRQATVSSKITGKVMEVLVEEGMEIREGQVLARLDDSIARKELALAEARLNAQRRALAETEVRLREAKLNQGRMRRLLEQGVSTQSQADTADAEVDSTRRTRRSSSAPAVTPR